MKTAAVVLLALLPVPLAAQGLGDAAARERNRRSAGMCGSPTTRGLRCSSSSVSVSSALGGMT